MTLFVLVALLISSEIVSATFNPFSLTKYNDFSKVPANNESILTGGRLIERHLAYLQQAEFLSLLSVVVFPTNDTVYNDVIGKFPSTDYEMSLATSYGLTSKYIASSLTVDSAKEVSAIIDSLPKPLYIHCHVGYTANLFTQMHLYLKGYIQANEIYSHSLDLGYDLASNSDVVSLLNSLTGSNDTVHSEAIEQNLAAGESSYKSYYWTHRLGHEDLWYNAGQVLDTHIDSIKEAGYTTYVSFRADHEATARLPTDNATGPVDNHEFSDALEGLYSVEEERSLVTSKGLEYFHLPLNSEESNTWTAATYEKYLPVLRTIDTQTRSAIKTTGKGAVLVHCASGYRSAAFTLTFLAQQQRLCSNWVLLQAQEVGFQYNNPNPTTTDMQVVAFIYSVLGC